MAELTNLDEKLAEVIGLAMAAQNATEKVAKLSDDEQLSSVLERMRAEAAEAEERGQRLVAKMEGRKTAILDKARETKSKAQDMMSTYLGDDGEALDGFEFLTMAEAGEVGHWKVLAQMAERAGNAELVDLTTWGIPIQEHHLQEAQDGAMRLAAEEDPDETA